MFSSTSSQWKHKLKGFDMYFLGFFFFFLPPLPFFFRFSKIHVCDYFLWLWTPTLNISRDFSIIYFKWSDEVQINSQIEWKTHRGREIMNITLLNCKQHHHITYSKMTSEISYLNVRAVGNTTLKRNIRSWGVWLLRNWLMSEFSNILGDDVKNGVIEEAFKVRSYDENIESIARNVRCTLINTCVYIPIYLYLVSLYLFIWFSCKKKNVCIYCNGFTLQENPVICTLCWPLNV